jgi:hypothetical protein
VDPTRAPGGPGPAHEHEAGAGPDAPHKGQFASDLLGEVLADGVRFDLDCDDEVSGSCTQLRQFLEERG